ncbi:hypothetical protein FGL86_16330 [Pistricoccus aurantiacus]|uniref:Polysaccharide lyase 14 domain-containing protein n=1 Tax=Pistricoccus aurantiacus TaxID=1883414 RepID=A0A5B8SWH3_9GAMM|nr:hypothetical protein [Pistricoccus aurantiacus]QEA40487.1 hypothetical protein FGL86_16330 [Pistricoccus aurantiacus]
MTLFRKLPLWISRAFGASLVLLCGFFVAGFSTATLAKSVDEKQLSIPTVGACSTRYPLVENPRIPTQDGDVEQSLIDSFGADRLWMGQGNIEIMDTLDTGLAQPGLRVHYPAKSSSPSDSKQNDDVPRGGAGFYTKPHELAGAERACLRYQVFFPEGFDFVKGGKLPGLYGGEAPSGGTPATGENGFTLRFMWRKNGQGELYEYVVNQPGDYGASSGRGRWTFDTGRWVTLEQEIVLNTPGKEDGLARVWVDGQPVLEQQGIVYRTSEDVTIDGIMFSTFFGGTGKGWRTPRDQAVDFADFRLYAPQSR